MKTVCAFLLVVFLGIEYSISTFSAERSMEELMTNSSIEAAPRTIEDITSTFSLLIREDFRLPGSILEVTLDEAINIALEENPQMRIARSGLRQSLANDDLTESAYRPQFDLDAQFEERLIRRAGGAFRFDPDLGAVRTNVISRENSELFSIGPRYNQTFKNGANISISPQFEFERDSEYPFDSVDGDGFRDDERSRVDVTFNFPITSRTREEIRRNIDNSKLDAIRSDYNRYIQQKSTIQQTINAYWSLKRQEEALEITNERLIQAKQVEFIFETQYEFENVAEMQVRQAQVDVLTTEADLITQESNYRNLIENFNIVLGLPIETNIVLEDDLVVTPLPLSNREYVNLVTSSNLELRDLELGIRQAENNLRVVRLGQQPDLNFQNFYSRDDEGQEDIGLGLIFSWPFGDGGATKARVRATQESLEQLRIRLWDLERALVQDTYQDLRDLELEEQRIQILERSVEQARVTLDNSLIMFREFGQKSFRDIQDDQIDLANSRNRLVNSKVSYIIAKSSLLQKVHDYQPSELVEPFLNLTR